MRISIKSNTTLWGGGKGVAAYLASAPGLSPALHSRNFHGTLLIFRSQMAFQDRISLRYTLNNTPFPNLRDDIRSITSYLRRHFC